MIQRVQSLYLLGAEVFLVLIMLSAFTKIYCLNMQDFNIISHLIMAMEITDFESGYCSNR